jgi:hypothetical protein
MKRVIIIIIVATMLFCSCQNNIERRVSFVGAENSGNQVLIDWDLKKNTVNIEEVDEVEAARISKMLYWDNVQEIEIENKQITITSKYDGEKVSETIKTSNNDTIIFGYNSILVSSVNKNDSSQEKVTIYANGKTNLVSIDVEDDIQDKPIAAIHYERTDETISIISSDFENSKLVNIELNSKGEKVDTHFIDGPVYYNEHSKAMPYPLFPQESLFIDKTMYFLFEGVHVYSINIETKEFNECRVINEVVNSLIKRHSEQGLSGVYIDFLFRHEEILFLKESYPEQQVEYILAFFNDEFLGAISMHDNKLFTLNDQYEENLVKNDFNAKIVGILN